jgi:5-amino-6-(5-phospho-D-ribitylamino)uracil phosphatase
MKRKFKAIICDVDGTLILNQKDALPTKKTIKFIKLAAEKIRFGIATSRPLYHVDHIIQLLNLSCPCVVCGGCQIYDPTKNKVVWKKCIDSDSIKYLKQISKIVNGEVILALENKDIFINELMKEDVFQFWFHGIPLEDTYKLERKLLKLARLSVHRIPSWKTGMTDFTITHKNASKEHAIKQIIRRLGIPKDQIIAVGDGANDLPLFKACGFRVAMGNVVPELKAVADYVAPSVEEDGIVDVINRFVL